MNPSSFCLAGLKTFEKKLSQSVNSFEITKQEINKFFTSVCNRFLHSFGLDLSKRKKIDDYNDKQAEVFIKCRESGFFDNCIFITDSGGFQVQTGDINRDKLNILIDKYHEFLSDKHHVYDHAFLLDILPDMKCETIRTPDELYEFNLRTYTIARNFPDHIREKLIYIHHFKTPIIWKIFNEILDSDGMFESFNYYACGGVANNMPADKHTSHILYIIPIIKLLRKTKEAGRNYLRFHVLGCGNLRDAFFHRLFEYHVKKVHNIDLKITHDTSGIFKGLLIGRCVPIMNGDMSIDNIDLKSGVINSLSITKLQAAIDEMCSSVGIKSIDIGDGIYISNDPGSSMKPDVELYLMFLLLYIYAKLENVLSHKIPDIYKDFENGNIESFNYDIHQLSLKINGNKVSSKLKRKTSSILNTLRVLSNLDLQYCEDVVNRFLKPYEFRWRREN